MGAPHRHMSILRNDNIARACRLFSQLSQFEFKEKLCHVSLFCLANAAKGPCLISNFRNVRVVLLLRLRVACHKRNGRVARAGLRGLRP